MEWQIEFHPLVLAEDVPTLDGSARRKIFKAIEAKLRIAPEQYGAPLRAPFTHYWKLGVGEYRVVYAIVKQRVVVQIIKIGARRDDAVYREMFKRLNRL